VHDVSIEERGGEMIWSVILVAWLFFYGVAIHYYAVKNGNAKGILAAYFLFFATAFLGYMAGQS
jgi:hypothetical protein